MPAGTPERRRDAETPSNAAGGAAKRFALHSGRSRDLGAAPPAPQRVGANAAKFSA